ncbi:MAG: hypothetical protein WKF89_09040 [Chitinophagaceae bacterium]
METATSITGTFEAHVNSSLINHHSSPIIHHSSFITHHPSPITHH